jgi:hypothetical protein
LLYDNLFVGLSKQKMIMSRSASYPREKFETAFDFVKLIYGFAGAEMVDRKGMAKIIGKSEGLAGDLASAAVQFDLMELKINEGYKVSSLFKRIDKPTNESERKEAIIEAISHPTIYSLLIDKYEGEKLPTGKFLENILFREYRIAEAATSKAASILIHNLNYAGLLTSDGILARTTKPSEASPNSKTETLSDTDGSDHQVTNQASISDHPSHRQKIRAKELKIPLYWERFATIIMPEDISKEEFELIAEDLKRLESRLFPSHKPRNPERGAEDAPIR